MFRFKILSFGEKPNYNPYYQQLSKYFFKIFIVFLFRNVLFRGLDINWENVY